MLDFLEQNPNYEYALHFSEWDSKQKTLSGAAQKCLSNGNVNPYTYRECHVP